MSFDEVFSRAIWRPIAGCPGRYSLPPTTTTLRSLLATWGSLASVTHQRVTGARDVVHVASLDDGAGLISYERDDGTFVHTLGTREGFARKRAQLSC